MDITVADGKGWDDYVLSNPGSFFYHLFSWGEAIEDVFGFKKIYLQAKEKDKICGLLPLVLVDTFSCKKLISIPIGVYAGVLADDETIATSLVGEAINLTKKYNCAHLELRQMHKVSEELASKELYVTFIKKLPASGEECLSAMPQHARAAVRHAVENDLTFDLGLRYLDECYNIYAINQRYLGSPVVSKKWFEKLVQLFRDKTNILAVKCGGRCIASVLTFYYRDTVLPFYGACIPKFFSMNPNNFMYLKLQEYAIEKGFKLFDFGRSRKDSGSFIFKKNQGFEPTQLHYQYYLHKAKDIPEVNPSNALFSVPKALWRMAPLCLTNRLGPKLFKYVIP